LAALGNEITDLQSSATIFFSELHDGLTNINAVSITTTGTLTAAEAVIDGTVNAGYFVGDGSGLTGVSLSNPQGNITSNAITLIPSSENTVNTVFTTSNRTLIISGVDNLTLQGDNITTATYITHQGSTSVRYLYFTGTAALSVGSTFVPTGGSTKHTVLSITTGTSFTPPVSGADGYITISSATDTEFSNISSGTIFNFTSGSLLGAVGWATKQPATSKGAVGDRQGMIYANSNTIYVCYTSYTDGAKDIWAKTATVSTTW
jgi:hypothetical protein